MWWHWDNLTYDKHQNNGGFMVAIVPTCTFIQKVSQQAAHDSLVADDQDIFLSLKLHNDWLHPLD